MKRILSTIMALLLVSTAFAVDDEYGEEPVEKAVERGRKALAGQAEILKEQREFEQRLIEVTEKARIAREAVTTAENDLSAYKTKTSLFRDTDIAAASAETKATLDGHKLTVEAAQKEYGKLQTALKNAQAQLAGLLEDSQNALNAANPTTVKASFDELKTQLKTLNLSDNFQKLAGKGVEIGARMEALERALDQANLGAYMREKFARFMSSQASCEIVEACEEDKEGNHNPMSFDQAQGYLDKVFHNPNGDLGRTRSGRASKNAGENKASLPSHK